MSAMPPIGSIGWCDLTIADAESLRDFYATVAGWVPEPLSMGDYSDYVMQNAEGTPTAGICHARGVNQAVPPQWLMYITVTNLDKRIASIRELGGTILDGPRTCGPNMRMCIFKDPAGAVAAICESTTAEAR